MPTQPCNFHSILTTAISMPSLTWREEVVNVGYSIQSTQEGEPPFVQHWHWSTSVMKPKCIHNVSDVHKTAWRTLQRNNLEQSLMLLIEECFE